MDDKTIQLVICLIFCLLFPPLAVVLKQGKITGQFWINIILTIMGFWILGMIHALIVVFQENPVA